MRISNQPITVATQHIKACRRGQDDQTEHQNGRKGELIDMDVVVRQSDL